MGRQRPAAKIMERFIRGSHYDPKSQGWDRDTSSCESRWFCRGLTLVITEDGLALTSQSGLLNFIALIEEDTIQLELTRTSECIVIGAYQSNSTEAIEAIQSILSNVPDCLRVNNLVLA